MSEIQGVNSVSEVAEDDKSLVSTDKSKVPSEDAAQNVQETSSETMRALEDIGKSLDFQHDSKDQPKRGEVLGRSVGECRNILPVLVEHLRSALELSAGSSNRNNESLAPHSMLNRHLDQDSKALKMDFNFFEDLLVIDIKTALVRLQDTLRRIDVDALNRYSSTLDPTDRLNLLQLISNLVANLKNAKLEELPQQPIVPVVPTVMKKKKPRGNRHTIGVSSEELARARKWLEERGTGISLTSQRLSLAPQSIQLENSPEIKEKVFESPRACDKHMKDAINQQQSLQNKSKDVEVSPAHESNSNIMNGEKFNEADVNEPSFNKCNKFNVKKIKIKRANTIDIPNYLKLQAQKAQSASPGLRRPIDISDRLSWNAPQVPNIIPSFEPKTENDRKFLALINRNNDSNTVSINQPFKSFNYRQTSSIADKNWKSRFSNIKTTFDKPSPPASVDGSSRRSSRDDGKGFSKEKDEALVTSLRLGRPPGISTQNNHNFQPRKPIFNHAASSPFKKIQTSPKIYQESEKLPPSYLPACASSGLLKAKMKMFDQETTDSSSRVQSGRAKVNVKPEKTVKDNGLNHCQIKTRDNSFHHDAYDRTRRHTIFNDENGVKLSIPELQRRQSVAVQTNNYTIPMNNVENHRHNSLMNPRFPRPQQYQLPMPRTFYSESENPIYVPPKPVPRDLEYFVDAPMNDRNDKKYWNRDSLNSDRFTDDDTSDHSFMDENIENQDISNDKIITRYASAIGTMEKSPSLSPSPSTFTPIRSPQETPILRDDVQRHNMLQQTIIRRLHHTSEEQEKPKPVISPLQRYSIIKCDRDHHLSPIIHPVEPLNGRESIEPLIESHNTQEKINIFEEKSIKKDRPEPLLLPRPPYVPPPPKINIISPPRALPQGFSGPPSIPPIPRKYSISPVDSSDEYLVSCANKPHRSIVLSKSESWHQLAMSKNHLQVPQNPPHKPPKVSSQSSKHFEASDALKKMEKVQSYFTTEQKCESKRRSFSPKKSQGVLSRSQTMPHMFDDASDVDKAFDSLFEEATRDNRH